MQCWGCRRGVLCDLSSTEQKWRDRILFNFSIEYGLELDACGALWISSWYPAEPGYLTRASVTSAKQQRSAGTQHSTDPVGDVRWLWGTRLTQQKGIWAKDYSHEITDQNHSWTTLWELLKHLSGYGCMPGVRQWVQWIYEELGTELLKHRCVDTKYCERSAMYLSSTERSLVNKDMRQVFPIKSQKQILKTSKIYSQSLICELICWLCRNLPSLRKLKFY